MEGEIQVPDWVRDAVFYEIVVDRFANGKKDNDDKYTRPWGSKSTFGDRQGGDLAGIRRKLDYLQELGVNALYLTPIFHAGSYHAYDTIDYYEIDPRFGTKAEFKNLVKTIHERGMRIILDGVFYHTSDQCPMFQSVLKDGEKSPYKDWYRIHKFPLNTKQGQDTYETWGGFNGMPLLNLDNPDCRKYLMDAVRYWHEEAGIDGWRLDTAREIGHTLFQEMRTVVREVNPNAYLVGEIWPIATNWLHGDEFDAVMNYPWRDAALSFFAHKTISPTEMDRRLQELRDSYGPAVTGVMLNMLGTHDTERMRTACQGNPLALGQCLLLQMTYPGAPMVYYGDERGMEGGKDPDNREAVPWLKRKWDRGFYDFTRRLIQLRHEHAVLRRGDYQTILTHDEHQQFGYMRRHENETALTLFNRSDAAQCVSFPLEVAGKAPFEDWLGTGVEVSVENGQLEISLPPHGMALLGRKG